MTAKLCIHCRHYSRAMYEVPREMRTYGTEDAPGYAPKMTDLCDADINLITGERHPIVPCAWIRAKGALCGPDGRLWEAKE